MDKSERRLTRSVNGSSPPSKNNDSSSTPSPTSSSNLNQSVKFDLDAADPAVLTSASSKTPDPVSIKSALRRSGVSIDKALDTSVASVGPVSDSGAKKATASENVVRTRSQNSHSKTSYTSTGDPDSLVGSLLTRRRSSTHLKVNLSASLGPMSPMETRSKQCLVLFPRLSWLLDLLIRSF